MFSPRAIVLHHTAGPGWWRASDIDREHRSQGWSGIGYHWAVGGDGRVERGRDSAVMGAHAKGYNAQSWGVALVGRFDGSRPGPHRAQWRAALGLADELCAELGIGPDEVHGHNEVGTTATVCPGFDPEDFRADLRALQSAWRPVTRWLARTRWPHIRRNA